MPKNDIPVGEARAWVTARSEKRDPLPGEKLRERVLDTAVQMLQVSRRGLTVSLDHLNMEELIRQADVPRSSVYRLWKTKDAFYVDLMERLIKRISDQGGAAWDEKTLTIAKNVIAEHKNMLRTEKGRRAVLAEAVRQGVGHNFGALSRSLSWGTSSALMATLPTLDEGARKRITKALQKTEGRFIDGMSEFYDQVMPDLGLRMKDPFDTKMLAVAASSVVEGLVDRMVVNADVIRRSIMLRGIDGQPAEWHLAAVGFLAIVDAMTEKDPDWHVRARLSRKQMSPSRSNREQDAHS